MLNNSLSLAPGLHYTILDLSPLTAARSVALIFVIRACSPDLGCNPQPSEQGAAFPRGLLPLGFSFIRNRHLD